MVDFYISWAPGLLEDDNALEFLSKKHLGIESRGSDTDFTNLYKHGVWLSIHNPASNHNKALADDGLVDILDNSKMTDLINNSMPDTVGFHIDYKGDPVDFSRDEVSSEVADNIKKVNDFFHANNLRKNVIFETNPFYHERIPRVDSEISPARLYTSSPEFISSVLEKNPDAGYLFDISHNLVSGYNRIKAELAKGTIDDYLDYVIDVTKGRVKQIHLNVPFVTPDYATDGVHMPFKLTDPNVEERELYASIFRAVNSILKNNDVDLLTLEMYTHLPSYDHARLLDRQAEYVKSKMDF
jgi:hypothetical protein